MKKLSILYLFVIAGILSVLFGIYSYAGTHESVTEISGREGKLILNPTPGNISINRMLPGDSETYCYILKNRTEYPVKFTFIPESEDRSSVLTKTVVCTVYAGCNEICRGVLGEMQQETITIGALSDKEIRIKLYFPIECGNEYANIALNDVIHITVSSDYLVEYYGPEQDSICIYHAPTADDPYRSTGEWCKVLPVSNLWRFRYFDGHSYKYVSDGWIYTYNPYSEQSDRYQWFCFDKSGLMLYGWYKEDYNSWYYLNEDRNGDFGSLHFGWLKRDPQDGYTYYLSQKDGKMYYGWKLIENDWYYFTEHQYAVRETWIHKFLDKLKIPYWIYTGAKGRPFGSMYRNELSPDGHMVNEEGKKNR